MTTRLLLAAAFLLAVLGPVGQAEARCATVGADGTSFTQCDLP